MDFLVKPFDPGELSANPSGKVTIKKHTFADAEGGNVTDTVSTVGTRRAQIIPLSSQDVIEARQVGEQITHRIRMRNDSTTATIKGVDHYFVLGSREFEIVGGVRDIGERREMLEFTCRERP